MSDHWPAEGATVWLKGLLAAGAVLAVVLLVQTVINYRYVSNNLILLDARRVAEERVRNVERAARLGRPQDAEAFRVLLDDVREDTVDQLAGIAVMQTNGSVVAMSGQAPPSSVPDQRRGSVSERDAPMTRVSLGGRTVLVGTFPCRCGLPRRAGNAEDQRPDALRLLVQVALYEDGLSAPFSRLRRNAIISAAAALSLLIALSLIAARAAGYVRGKQLEVQMELAREVQRDLLPPIGAHPAGVDVAAEFLPASQVGGDFYDIVTLAGGRVSFVVGDVSGHGISAALLMGLIHGAMSNPPWGASEDPDRAALRLNDLLLTKSSGERFASLFWCSYDPASSVIRYLNAGHLPAVWLRRETNGTRHPERLAEGGPVLGLLPAAAFKTSSVSASEGDLLVLFSDGITEAPNRREEQFGDDRLIAILQEAADLPAQAICQAILDSVRAFAGDRPTPDDQTLLVVRLWRAASETET
jgi:hypothetical protein